MEEYSRPSNCEKLNIPRVNGEIWDKVDNKTKHNDLRATSTQKTLAKSLPLNYCKCVMQPCQMLTN